MIEASIEVGIALVDLACGDGRVVEHEKPPFSGKAVMSTNWISTSTFGILKRPSKDMKGFVKEVQATIDPVSYTHLTLPTIYSV